MVLKAKVATLDELPEGLRSEYKKGPDGNFYPDLDNVEALPAIAGLKQSRDDVLEEKRKLIVKYQPFANLPEDKITAVAAHVQAGKPLLEASAWETQKAEMTTQFENEKKPLEATIHKMKGFLDQTLVAKEILEQGKDLAHNPALLVPFLSSSIQVVETPTGYKASVIDPTSKTERIGDSAGTPMSIKGRILELAAIPEYKSLFKNTGASGTLDGENTNTGDNPPPSGAPGDLSNLPRDDKGKISIEKLTDAQKSGLIDKHGIDGYRRLVGI